MGQQQVLEIIKDLGGHATALQVGEECRKRGYISGSYNPYYILQRLRKWDLIKYDAKTRIFSLTDSK